MEDPHESVATATMAAKRLRMRANRQPGLRPQQRAQARSLAARLETAAGSVLRSLGHGLPAIKAGRPSPPNPTGAPDGIPSRAPQAPAPAFRDQGNRGGRPSKPLKPQEKI